MNVRVDDEEIIALFGQTSIDCEFSCCCFSYSILKVQRFDAQEFFVSRVLQESFDEVRVIFNSIVDEKMNFVLWVVHRENLIKILLQKRHRSFDEKRNKNREGIFLFLILDVVLRAPTTLSIDESVCEVICKAVEVDFRRSIAVDK